MKPDTSLKIALGLTTNERKNRGHTKETRSGKEYPNIRAERQVSSYIIYIALHYFEYYYYVNV